ncbi:MAG: hypothetical protein NZX77_07860 [Polyangiaceae bacterium]|nr:hypothetical protein [Polyangiaceae bacterium]
MRSLCLRWAALLFPSCGLAGPVDLEPRVDPGKGAFGEPQALEVCLGTARLDPHPGALGPRGLCVSDGAPERPCDGEDGCSPGERCLCGRCTLDTCRPNAPCDEGRLCRDGLCTTPCQHNHECPQGQVCSGGGCAIPCQQSGGCGRGGRCDLLSGTCRADSCENDAACGAGRYCDLTELPAGIREPAWLSADQVVLETREREKEGVRSRIRRATLNAPRRLLLEATPLLEDAGAPAPLRSGGAPKYLFTETADGRIERRLFSENVLGSGEVVLTPQEPWEQGRVGSPSAVEFRGETLLFYEAGDGTAVGVVQVSSGERRRLLTPTSLVSPGRWEKIEWVGAPDAVTTSGGLLLVYFTARGVEGASAWQGTQEFPPDSNESLGLMASEDGIHFDIAPGPLVARRSNLRTYLGERESAAWITEQGATLIFVAADATGAAAGLGLLRSP